MSFKNVEIRLAVSEDAEEVLKLARELATSLEVNPDRFRESFKSVLGDPASLVLVATADDYVAGYLPGFDHLAFFANGPVSRIEEVFVVPELRRNRIGSALVAEFEKWADSRGSKQILIDTRRASEFYLGIGYKETAFCVVKGTFSTMNSK
jgi:GNAT superfamily N-acetyltransferase